MSKHEEELLFSGAPVESVHDPALTARRQMEDLLFGSLGGMAGKVVEYPFDTVKVLLQTQSVSRPLYKGAIDCISVTVKRQGALSLYRGMLSPLIGSMLENAILFVGYKEVQRWIRAHYGISENTELSMSHHLFAGSITGAMASVVLTPAELIKCKLQVQFAPDTQKTYQGPWETISTIFRKHGMAGFYRGFMPTMLREMGGSAFWFGVYEATCAALLRRRQQHHSEPLTRKDLPPSNLLLAGALGGIAYNVSLFPIDVIKSRIQTEEERPNTSPQRRSLLQVAREIYKGAGIRGFYRGCGITAVRSAPASATIFLTYELLTRHFGS